MAASYNELFGLGSHSPDANLEGWWPLQDDAASTTVLDYSGSSRNGIAAQNTAVLATTGPSSWLTSAFNFNGSSDHVQIAANAAYNSSSAVTVISRAKIDAFVSNQNIFSKANIDGTVASPYVQWSLKMRASPNDRKPEFQVNIGGVVHSVAAASNRATATWYHLAGVYDGSDVVLYEVGSSIGSTGATGSIQTYTTAVAFGRWNGGRIQYLDGVECDNSIFSRALTQPEVAEAYNGPELINTAAPTLSGTETVGQTLSSTTGTWALDAPFSGGSNGTASYSYQWTRSDHGTGTGEANISGATSSTYTLQAADAGKFIRCFVRATNDGGFDPEADTPTAFTGAISGGFNPAWAKFRNSKILGRGLV